MNNRSVFICLILLLSSSCASLIRQTEDNERASLRYNIYEEEWSYAYPTEQLRFNIYENRWEFSH